MNMDRLPTRWEHVGQRLCLLAAGAGLFLVLPHFISSFYVLLFTEILIFAVFALSLNLLLGYAGLVSLGHAAFFGAAAYTVALLSVKAGVDSFWICFIAGILVATVLGLLLGLLALRARGLFFIMLTLALAQMVWAIVWRWHSLTGGDDGLPGIARPDLGLPWSWAITRSTTQIYYTPCYKSQGGSTPQSLC